jgi:NADPH-dependent 2,4-dienoyl-CoA reductase/sulfur reductase-like enzyme
LVGAGLKTLKESGRELASLVPKNAALLNSSVTKIDPETNSLVTADGKTIKYEYLVVAPGMQIHWNKIPGLLETLGKNGVSSNYDVNSVQKTFENIKNFNGGRAVFTQPSTPIKCAGAPQKIMYLAEENFSKRGIREKSNVEFYTGMGKIFAIDKYGTELTKICKNRDIKVNLQMDLVSILPEKKQAIFKNLAEGGSEVIVDYDMLHVTPPMSAPAFIEESGISDAAGWVEVNKETTQHVKYKNIFSLGDSSSLPTSKTAAGFMIITF